MGKAPKQETLAPLSWRLQWSGGRAEVQALGAMLGPVSFRLNADRELQVMHVAPWAEAAEACTLPGVLRRLRGEWPCAPFGRVDLPDDLPPGWQARPADDAWPHGYGSNHLWTCEHAQADRVLMSIDYPSSSAIARIEREIVAVPGEPALQLVLTVHARRDCTLPVALHPTFQLPSAPGRVLLELAPHEGVYTYPSRSAGQTRLVPDRCADALCGMPGVDGQVDLSRLPLASDSEELIQVRGLKAEAGQAPLRLRYLDHDAWVELDWDLAHLPDLMLWVSNRGRHDYPWMGHHVALGAEPLNGVFDLGRVASPPACHGLADRQGIQLLAGQPWTTRYRISARAVAP